ncbi:MAG: PD-(D/E)XK nuclease family protein [Oscillospiraceae bacterium]
MLTLLLGRAGTGKTNTILNRLGEDSKVRPQLLIVPEQYSHDTERRLCKALGNAGARRAEVLSFTRLYSRVCDRAGGGAAPCLDAGGRLLLMRAAIKEVEESLTVYRNPSRKSAFLTSLIATADECKSYRVAPEQLLDAAETIGGLEGDKLHDLGLIFGAYDALTARVAADPRDRLTRLAEGIVQCGWPSGHGIWVDGFTDFTPQEALVLQRLLERGNSLTVALTCDSLDGEDDDIFAPARRTAHTLLRIAKEAGVLTKVEVLNETGGRAPVLLHLEENLFTHPGTVWEGECPEIAVFAADSPRSEVEYAAATILKLVREEGWRFRDFAVAARNFDAYADQVESVFALYGVPVFLSTVTDILEKPVLTLITAALDTVSGGYQYEDLFRYLKTGLTDLTDEERDLLENYAITWDLRGSRWTQKADWTMHPDGYGLPFLEADTAALAALNASRRKVVEPLERLRKNKDKTGRGFALALYRFLEDIGLPDRLTARAAELEEAGERKLADEYRQLWEILTGALEQCALLLADTELDLEEFASLFKLVLSQYDVGTIPVSLDRVTAGDAPRLAHKRAKMLILLGADDGSIPAVVPAPGLLTDPEREILAEQGLELAPRLADKLSREMTIVYTTCAVPSERLLVTWPRSGEKSGEERRPSFLVERLALLYPKMERVEEGSLNGSFRLSAPGPALELAGRDELAAAALERLEDHAGRVERIKRAADVRRGALSRPAVEGLYGQRLPMSATRMDACKSCHFSYFLRFGLKAKARQAAGFHAPEYGTFVHYVLEHVLGAVSQGDNRDVKVLTDEAVTNYVTGELGGMAGETPRFRYLFERLKRTVAFVVENAVEELRVSQFRPIAFELGFGPGKDLPPVEVQKDGLTVSVTGFVDRVDGWEHNGKLYLRVVDYKTGRKSFDFTDIQNGLSLQMLLYLFALERQGLMGKEVESAGVLYVHAKDVLIAGSRSITEETCREKAREALRREGLVLDDEEVLRAMEDWGQGSPKFLPLKVDKSGTLKSDYLVKAEQMGKLSRKVMETLEDITAELAAGNIDADPYWRSPDANACRYCEYAEACHFEECFGDKKVWQKPVKAKEFWEKLDETP